MATTNENTDRTVAGGDSNQPAKPVSEAAVSATKKSLKDQDAEWGFEPSRSGMATEAKMGMFIVVILVCAFCFLVYHKFDMKQRALLQASMQASGENPESGGDDASLQAAIDSQSASFNEFYPAAGATEAPTEFAQASLREPLKDEFLNSSDNGASSSVPSQFDRQLGSNDDSLVALTQPPSLDPSAPTEFSGVQNPAADSPTKPEDPFAILAARNSSGSAEPAPRETFGSTPAVAVTNPPRYPAFEGEQLSDPVFEPTSTNATASQSTTAFDESPSNLFPAKDDGDLLPAVAASGASPFAQFNEQEAFTSSVASSAAKTDSSPSFEVPAFDSPSIQADTRLDYDPVGSVPARPVSQSLAAEERALPPADVSPFERNPEPAFDEPAFNRDLVQDLAYADEEPPGQLIAMLEPKQDVNLFEDDFAPSAKSPQAFPVAEEPSMPQFGKPENNTAGSNPSDGLFPREPVAAPAPDTSRDEFVPKPRTPAAAQPKVIQPPAAKPGFFDEPINKEPPRQFTTSPPQQSDSAYDRDPTSTARSVTTVRTPVDQVQPEFGVAQFVHGGPIQQVAGIDESCDICEVQINDTYWTISKRAYGTAKYFSSLAVYNQNRIPDPKKLRPGMKVLIPAPEVLETKYPEFFKDSQPKAYQPKGYFLRTDGTPAYRVGGNETLSEISQKHLGRASRWNQIYQMNRQTLKDPNKLKLGTVLVLPDDATDVHVAP